jgi:hypothetical protein
MAEQITNPEAKLSSYRKAAEEALRSAERVTDPEIRKAYINIMNTWIYLADELEREMQFWDDHENSPIDQPDEVFVPPHPKGDRHRSR